MIDTRSIPKLRRGLSADSLHQTLRRRFESVEDDRRVASCTYPMADTLMSAFAMFATKEPSMLSAQDQQRELHIEKPFPIQNVPSDTQMRTILDGINSQPLHEAFADLYPKLNLLVVEDGLASNAPYIADLQAARMHFLLGAKPGDHEHLFDQVRAAMDGNQVRVEHSRVASPRGTHDTQTQSLEDLELNQTHPDVRVNFLQHHQFDSDTAETIQGFSCIAGSII